MCIINSCQPDIKICFFPLFPTPSPRALYPTRMPHGLGLLFRDFIKEPGDGQLFCEAVLRWSSTRSISSQASQRKTATSAICSPGLGGGGALASLEEKVHRGCRHRYPVAKGKRPKVTGKREGNFSPSLPAPRGKAGRKNSCVSSTWRRNTSHRRQSALQSRTQVAERGSPVSKALIPHMTTSLPGALSLSQAKSAHHSMDMQGPPPRRFILPDHSSFPDTLPLWPGQLHRLKDMLHCFWYVGIYLGYYSISYPSIQPPPFKVPLLSSMNISQLL